MGTKMHKRRCRSGEPSEMLVRRTSKADRSSDRRTSLRKRQIIFSSFIFLLKTIKRQQGKTFTGNNVPMRLCKQPAKFVG